MKYLLLLLLTFSLISCSNNPGKVETTTGKVGNTVVEYSSSGGGGDGGGNVLKR